MKLILFFALFLGTNQVQGEIPNECNPDKTNIGQFFRKHVCKKEDGSPCESKEDAKKISENRDDNPRYNAVFQSWTFSRMQTFKPPLHPWCIGQDTKTWLCMRTNPGPDKPPFTYDCKDCPKECMPTFEGGSGQGHLEPRASLNPCGCSPREEIVMCCMEKTVGNIQYTLVDSNGTTEGY